MINIPHIFTIFMDKKCYKNVIKKQAQRQTSGISLSMSGYRILSAKNKNKRQKTSSGLRRIAFTIYKSSTQTCEEHQKCSQNLHPSSDQLLNLNSLQSLNSYHIHYPDFNSDKLEDK
jgi:hypothetical protein